MTAHNAHSWSDHKERSIEELQKAREYAASFDYNCIKAAKEGTLGFASHVTPKQVAEYIERQEESAKAILRGDHDGNFTIWQRMNTYLTGECVALLA